MRTAPPETPSSSPSSFSFQPRKPARRRPPHSADASTPPPPAPLVLVAAAYDNVSLILTLTFDRPVDIAAFDGTAVQVGDPTFNFTLYNGTGGAAYLAGPAVVGIYLAQQDDYFGTEVDLMADGTSGIVAVDDGAAWAGTGGIVFLPYP